MNTVDRAIDRLRQELGKAPFHSGPLLPEDTGVLRHADAIGDFTGTGA